MQKVTVALTINYLAMCHTHCPLHANKKEEGEVKGEEGQGFQLYQLMAMISFDRAS